MAISTGDSVIKAGTQTTVSAGGGTSSVSSGAYSASGDAASYTHTDDTPMASAVLTMQYPSGTINTGGIQLLCRLIDIDGTGDEPALTANWVGHALGQFITGTGMSATTNYSLGTGPFVLPLIGISQKYEFYIRNSCGVTITAGWTLKLTPITLGPK